MKLGDMNRYTFAVLAATLIAGLTACGGGASQASSSSASASASPSQTKTSRPVPDVAGKKYAEAYKILSSAGFYGNAYGKDGKKWTNTTPDASIVVVSTSPAAGTVTDTEDIEIHVGITEAEHAAVAKAAADARKAAADAAAKAAAAPKVTGLAASLPAKFPGYPLIVHAASLDYRVANWFKGKLVDDQVVALIPGVYTPYNPNVKDLLAYYETGGDGDSMMRKTYMPDTGGAGWSGVLPGPEEPK